jgi:Mg/Co/Ni transporter MgtE
LLRAFECDLEAVVALAFFIPLLTGTGGNTGTQIITTPIRSTATGQVRFRDVPATPVKEVSTSVSIATIVDGTGLLIYFSIAKLTLSQLAAPNHCGLRSSRGAHTAGESPQIAATGVKRSGAHIP